MPLCETAGLGGHSKAGTAVGAGAAKLSPHHEGSVGEEPGYSPSRSSEASTPAGPLRGSPHEAPLGVGSGGSQPATPHPCCGLGLSSLSGPRFPSQSAAWVLIPPRLVHSFLGAFAHAESATWYVLFQSQLLLHPQDSAQMSPRKCHL